MQCKSNPACASESRDVIHVYDFQQFSNHLILQPAEIKTVLLLTATTRGQTPDFPIPPRLADTPFG